MLAQVDPTKAIADGFGTQFLPYALALVTLALVGVFKLLWDQSRGHATEIAATNKAHTEEISALNKAHSDALALAHTERLADMKADAKEQREILSQIVPLAAKLTEGLEILERLTQARE